MIPPAFYYLFIGMQWELRPPVSWVKLLSSEAVILGIRRKGPKSVFLCRDPCSSSLTYTAVIRYSTETTTSDLDPVDVSHHRLPGSFCHPSVLELILIKVPVGTLKPCLSLSIYPCITFPRSTCFMQTETFLLCSHLYPQDRGWWQTLFDKYLFKV